MPHDTDGPSDNGLNGASPQPAPTTYGKILHMEGAGEAVNLSAEIACRALDKVRDGVALWRYAPASPQDATLVYLNDSGRNMSSRPWEDLIERSMREEFPTLIEDGFLDSMAKTVSSKQSVRLGHVEYEGHSFSVTLHPFSDNLILVTYEDITDELEEGALFKRSVTDTLKTLREGREKAAQVAQLFLTAEG